MPLLLGIPLIVSAGALAWKSITGDTASTVDRMTPNLLLLAAAGAALYFFVLKPR